MSIKLENMSPKEKSWSKFADKYDPIKIGSIDGTDTEPHDRALIRAINSEYWPNKRVQGDPTNTVFVARLNPRTTQETIKTEFSKFGKIINCRLVKDIVTGKSRGYAFIEYEREGCAERAVAKMHKEYIDSYEVITEMEVERTMPGWRPRRLGGGFGGRKEAGQLRFGCNERPFRKPILLHNQQSEQQNKRFHSDSKGHRQHTMVSLNYLTPVGRVLS